MLNRLAEIKGLRDSVVSKKMGEGGKPLRSKDCSTSKNKKSKHIKPRIKSEGKKNINTDFEYWMNDVNEAVDQFIGMDMDVLPKMPWKKWFKSGLSAVVAAKNAVQMYEDLEEEDDPEDDNIEDDDDLEEEELDELFGMTLPYHKWYKKLVAILDKKNVSLENLKDKFGIKNTKIHSWYNSGYDPNKVALMLIGMKPTKVQAESKIVKSLGEWASTLGIRKDSTVFAEDVIDEQTDEEDSVEEDVEDEENNGLFGLTVNELAERAKKMAKPKVESAKFTKDDSSDTVDDDNEDDGDDDIDDNEDDEESEEVEEKTED